MYGDLGCPSKSMFHSVTDTLLVTIVKDTDEQFGNT